MVHKLDTLQRLRDMFMIWMATIGIMYELEGFYERYWASMLS